MYSTIIVYKVKRLVIVESPISVHRKQLTSDGRAGRKHKKEEKKKKEKRKKHASTFDGYFRIGPLRRSPSYGSAT